MVIMTLADLFCRMWSTWQTHIPKPLAGENPQVLSHLLRVADIKGGISQKEIQRGLGLHQSRVSKLVDKLLDQKWVQVVPQPVGDRRIRLVRTTPKARNAMRLVEAELSSALNVKSNQRPRRKGHASVPGLMDLLSQPER